MLYMLIWHPCLLYLAKPVRALRTSFFPYNSQMYAATYLACL